MSKQESLNTHMKFLSAFFALGLTLTCAAVDKPDPRPHQPIFWESQPPQDCPFEQSRDLTGICFTGVHSDYVVGDTWYPSWASDDNLYSPFTDGYVADQDSNSGLGENATTGNAVMIGGHPLQQELKNTAPLQKASALPYQGRYPCGSLVHNGVWYYGTYCLGPKSSVEHEGFNYNWPILGPMPGFRISSDYGKTWTASPLSPEKPLFPEPAKYLGPVKMGAPHFVDFGKNMEHSPDGKAYLLGMGTDESNSNPRYANLSWITADQIYMSRVTPSVQNINDITKYEFFAGFDSDKQPLWTTNFDKIKPLLTWNNHLGCVTATYNPRLKKYLMCITDGLKTASKMNSFILEADQLTGPWRMVVYMKDFGEQGYFLNFPSKFIQNDGTNGDGRTLWLCYSANFYTPPGEKIKDNPPGSHYGLHLAKCRLLQPGEGKDITPSVSDTRSLVLTSPVNRIVYQRDNANKAHIPVVGMCPRDATRIEARLVPRVRGQGTPTEWTLVTPSPANGAFRGTVVGQGGWYTLEVRALRKKSVVASGLVERVGIGEVFAIVGHSVAAGTEGSIDGATDDRVITAPLLSRTYQEVGDPRFLPFSFVQFGKGVIPVPMGSGSYFWSKFGEYVTQKENVPVLIFNAAFDGTTLEHWAKSSQNIQFEHSFVKSHIRMPYINLYNTFNKYIAVTGIRAVLADQGQNDWTEKNEEIIFQNFQTWLKQARTDLGYPDLAIVVNRQTPFLRDVAVRKAQERIIQTPNGFPGPNYDTLAAEDRPDAIHLGPSGEAKAARMWADALDAKFFRSSKPWQPTY